ncbi:CaiB/BaiF CoA-transferase family protein [Microbacterium sp. NPDC096154]|uniref:CaiB/BaiF CoA transferase family protein n=1 Tax=Microbacterium sp. NPDC096154 TaxID=3155549 RepID=UPI003321CE36
MSTGPLSGLRVVILLSPGPTAHAGLMLSDLGADVVQVARPGWLAQQVGGPDHTRRGQRIVEADLKDPAQHRQVFDLVSRADVLVEGYRPGVAERLGLGPEDFSSANPGLVYGRMTGWGQNGPRAQSAGHDINYLSLTGHLHAMSRQGARPQQPLNLVGDYGGGSMFLIVGVLSALLERVRSGRGQVVDAAMVDGASMLGHWVWAMRARGRWSDAPGTNMLDGGLPEYDVYETADGRYVAVGALEAPFYAQLLHGLGLSENDLPLQTDVTGRERRRASISAAFRTRTREEWVETFAGTDACVTPVLGYAEAAADEHVVARGTLIEIDGVTQPAPAPRFSRTAAGRPQPPATRLDTIATIWA